MSLLLPPPGTRSGVLRNLRHMQPLVKRPGGKFADKQPSFARSTPKFVQPKDRIAYWNIAPGDEVRVTVGGKKIVDPETGDKKVIPWEGTVATLDRERNLVWLRSSEEGGDDALIPKNIKHIGARLKDPEKGESEGYTPNMAFQARPVHYSSLQLKLPADLALPKDVKDELDLKKGVYASRIVRSKAWYNRDRGYFTWKRFAIVRGAKGNLRIEIPWHGGGEGRSKRQQKHASVMHVVDNETWIPWDVSDPLQKLTNKKWTSPQALERLRASLQQSADDKAKNGLPTMAGKAVIFNTKTRKYEAATTRGVKPPLVAQPPTPAEQIWQRNQSTVEWLQAEKVRKHVEEGGRTFAAADYLNVTPIEGPSDAHYQSLLFSSASIDHDGEEGESSTSSKIPRNLQTGKLQDHITRRDLDSWPIELLMEGDLTNKYGLRNRMRRWKERQAKQAEKEKRMVIKESRNLDRLREKVDENRRGTIVAEATTAETNAQKETTVTA